METNNIITYDDFLFEKEEGKEIGKIMIILGPPGSGKGTVSKRLSEKKGIKHISTGALIRNSNDKKLKNLISKGNFIPDPAMLKILKAKLKETDLSSGIILDGFPRTIKQAKMLDSMLGKMGMGLSHVIYLDVSEEKAKERIKRRADKENRDDDRSDKIIEKRFQEYKDKTLPLMDFYSKSRKAVKVDASKSPTTVYKSIVKKLGL